MNVPYLMNFNLYNKVSYSNTVRGGTERLRVSTRCEITKLVIK